jgi:hypothetical protein
LLLKKQLIILSVILFVLVTLFIGVAGAARDPEQTFETQGINSVTNVELLSGSPGYANTFSTSKELVFSISNNGGLNEPSLMDPFPLGKIGPYLVILKVPGFTEDITTPGGVQYTTSYKEDTNAVNGATSYSGTLRADTANKVLGQDNINAHRNIQFGGNPNGQLTSSENILLDGAGAATPTADEFICPFAASESQMTDEFCNIVRAGSTMQITMGSVVTDASDRFVAATSDYGNQLDYGISLKGVGGFPAAGDVGAYIDVHAQEGRTELAASLPICTGEGCPTGEEEGSVDFYTLSQGLDFTYNEKTSASGWINEFTKTMHYDSMVL